MSLRNQGRAARSPTAGSSGQNRFFVALFDWYGCATAIMGGAVFLAVFIVCHWWSLPFLRAP